MKHFVSAALAALLFTFAQSASALPSLGAISGDSSLDGVFDDGSELFSFTDSNTLLDDADLLITLRNATGQNRVFIYDDLFPAIELTVFDFADPVLDAQTLAFDVVLNQVSVGLQSIILANANGIFGIGIESETGDKYYSQTALNADGFDHMLAFDVSALDGSLFSLGNYVFAWEDQLFGGDQDWDDAVINATDLVARAVPVPAPLALMGLGMLGLVGLRKKV